MSEEQCSHFPQNALSDCIHWALASCVTLGQCLKLSGFCFVLLV